MKLHTILRLSFSLWVLGLVACSSETNYAPVMDIATIEHVPQNGRYRVSSGETLYSIAFRYGLDYRYVASVNHILPPYHVASGQSLYLREKPGHITTQKVSLTPQGRTVTTTSISLPRGEHQRSKFQIIEREPSFGKISAWRRPANGPILASYSSLNKGINIGGYLGAPIYASAAGQVVYSGNRLRGYGNLIIIKHNSTFLTAYAHTYRVFVKEGDRVRAGQRIAEMGNSGTQRVMLHFEIRRGGRPVNPLHYLY